MIPRVNVLILGSGAREHALYHAILGSRLASSVYALPGNAGFQPESLVTGISITKFDSILSFVESKNIGLIIVGPETPLALGIKDFFSSKKPDVFVFGPDANSSQLEASKAFAVKYMQKRNIPTAESRISHSLHDSLHIIEEHSLPVVIKVDGLAGGKGVSIHKNKEEAKSKLKEIFVDKTFGKAGESVVIQSFMCGRETSLFALMNGKEAIYLPKVQDYKPVFDRNQGPNTGGMGAYSPTEHLTEEQISFVHRRIVVPILEDFSYTGVLYIGLMVHSNRFDDVSVLEFNCRFGDPEIQTILPLLEVDILPYLFWACGCSEVVPKVKANDFYYLPSKNQASVNVVLTARGYPNSHAKEIPFSIPKTPQGVQVVHASTMFAKPSSGGSHDYAHTYVSQGGRILNIIGTTSNIAMARELVYNYIKDFSKANAEEMIKFHFRQDIALLDFVVNSQGKLA